jgi:hypothetical protein
MQDVMTVKKQDGSVAKWLGDQGSTPVMDRDISLHRHIPTKSGVNSTV